MGELGNRMGARGGNRVLGGEDFKMRDIIDLLCDNENDPRKGEITLLGSVGRESLLR